MINVLLLWFLLPILLGTVGIFYFNRSQVREALTVSGTFFLVSLLTILVAFYGSQAAATADVEIWNGKVLGKQRVQDTYEESYQCNCRTVTSGSGQNRTTRTECDTCYRTHYTVDWNVASTLGPFKVDSADSLSRSVYNTPDPHRWTIVQKDDPVSTKNNYTNYIQAVPESLFRPAPERVQKQFAGLIPPYPDQIYDLYRINRFLTPGYTTPDSAKWNADISNMLRDLGPRKQVNAIVVIAKTDDSNYEYALRDAWCGAKKNDVVLLIGSKTWPTIDFVRVLTWSKSETFKIELRDAVQNLGTIQREPIMALLEQQISKNFVRRHMKEFEYLKAEIDPPNWVLALCTVLIVAYGVFGAWILNQGRFRTVFRGTKIW